MSAFTYHLREAYGSPINVYEDIEHDFWFEYCQLQRKLKGLETELGKSREKHTLATNELQTLRKTLDAVTGEKEQITLEMKSIIENKNRIEDRNNYLKEQLHLYQNRYIGIETSYKREQPQKAEKIINQLETEVQRYKSDKDNLNRHLNGLLEENRRYKELLNRTFFKWEQAQQAEKIINHLETEVKRYKSDNDNLNCHLNDLSEENRRLKELLKRQNSTDLTTLLLQAEVFLLKSTIASHQRENEQLKGNAEQHKKEKYQLEHKIRQKCKDVTTRSLQAEIVQLKSTITSHQRENEQLKENVEQLKKEKLEGRISTDMITSQLKSELYQLKSTTAGQKRENEKLNDYAKQLKNEKHQLEERIRQNSTDITTRQLKSELDQLKSTITSQKRENEKLNDYAEQLKKKKHQLEERITAEERIRQNSTDITTRQLKSELDQLKSTIASQKGENEKLNDYAEQLKKEKHQLEERIRQQPSDILTDTLKCKNCRKYRKDIADLKADVNNLRDRLSEAAGNKLRDNNPNIADLSDMNRPTSLAEKFSSLYTDEYTDAFEDIEVTMDEKSSALFMLELLKSCYDWGKKLAEEQRQLLSRESFGFMKNYLEHARNFQLSETCYIYVKEFQKKIAADGDNLKAVEMICLENGMKKANLKSNPTVKRYMKKCSQLCWMMQISDPPMYLNFDVKAGEQLDKNVYNVFTKSGSQIEFLVWPAMFIHSTGPILAKGVAQGK